MFNKAMVYHIQKASLTYTPLAESEVDDQTLLPSKVSKNVSYQMFFMI